MYIFAKHKMLTLRHVTLRYVRVENKVSLTVSQTELFLVCDSRSVHACSGLCQNTETAALHYDMG